MNEPATPAAADILAAVSYSSLPRGTCCVPRTSSRRWRSRQPATTSTLTVPLPAAPAPDPASPGLVRRIVDGLLGTAVPAGWADRGYVLKGDRCGRA